MPRRDFGAAQAPPPDPDPIEFTLSGREFRCAPAVTPEALVAMTGLPALPAVTDPGYESAAIAWATGVVGFLLATVDDPAALDDVLDELRRDNPEQGLGIVADIFAWLCDTYAGRIDPPDATPARPFPNMPPPADPWAREPTPFDDVLDLVLAGVGEIGEQGDG